MPVSTHFGVLWRRTRTMLPLASHAKRIGVTYDGDVRQIDDAARDLVLRVLERDLERGAVALREERAGMCGGGDHA